MREGSGDSGQEKIFKQQEEENFKIESIATIQASRKSISSNHGSTLQFSMQTRESIQYGRSGQRTILCAI